MGESGERPLSLSVIIIPQKFFRVNRGEDSPEIRGYPPRELEIFEGGWSTRDWYGVCLARVLTDAPEVSLYNYTTKIFSCQLPGQPYLKSGGSSSPAFGGLRERPYRRRGTRPTSEGYSLQERLRELREEDFSLPSLSIYIISQKFFRVNAGAYYIL